MLAVLDVLEALAGGLEAAIAGLGLRPLLGVLNNPLALTGAELGSVTAG